MRCNWTKAVDIIDASRPINLNENVKLEPSKILSETHRRQIEGMQKEIWKSEQETEQPLKNIKVFFSFSFDNFSQGGCLCSKLLFYNKIIKSFFLKICHRHFKLATFRSTFVFLI